MVKNGNGVDEGSKKHTDNTRENEEIDQSSEPMCLTHRVERGVRIPRVLLNAMLVCCQVLAQSEACLAHRCRAMPAWRLACTIDQLRMSWMSEEIIASSGWFIS